MPSYLLLELNSRFADGWYFQTSLASAVLASHRSQFPDGRWTMLQLRSERDRPQYEAVLPLAHEEWRRLSCGTVDE